MGDLIQQRKFQYVCVLYVHTETSPVFLERCINNVVLIKESAESSDVGLRPLASWDCGFESRRGLGCLSLVNVVCCEADISALG